MNFNSVFFPQRGKPNQINFIYLFKLKKKKKSACCLWTLPAVCTWPAMSVSVCMSLVCTHVNIISPFPSPPLKLILHKLHTSSTLAHPTRPVQLVLLRPCTYFVFGEAQTGKSICDFAHVVICSKMLLLQFNIQSAFCIVVDYLSSMSPISRKLCGCLPSY
jgi:hypothetical protein